MSNPVKQHYVPQVYLRYFACKRTKTWEVDVADKKGNKLYRANVRNVAFEKNFYTIERLKEKKYAWEEYYSKQVEPLIGKTFTRFIQRCTSVFTKDGDTVLDEEIRAALSVILVTQHLRTPKARQNQYEIGTDIFPTIMGKIISELDPHIRSDQREYLDSLTIDDIFKDIDMGLVTDPKRIGQFAQIVHDRCWIVYRNDNHESNPFVTSDHPVVLYNMVTKDTTLENNGIGNPQTVIHFPINSQLILAIYDKRNFLFQPINDLDGQIRFLNKSNDNDYILKMNRMQYEQCIQHVFFRPFI